MSEYDIAASKDKKELIIGRKYPLQHEGRLRGPFRPGAVDKEAQKAMIAGTRKHGTNYSRARQVMKPCGHFCYYAFSVYDPDLNAWCLGIEFIHGKSFYYPNTASATEPNPWVAEMTQAESGSYFFWDNIKDKTPGEGFIELIK